jgi:hypothetical protein
MLRSLLVTAAVALGALTGAIEPTASAAPPVDVSINATVTQFAPTFQGDWQASGAISDSGSFVEPFARFTGSTEHSPVVAAFQAVLVFSGSQGTLAVRQQLTFTAAASNGVWEVASGTGAYERASGHGTFEFVFPDNLTFTGVISKAP